MKKPENTSPGDARKERLARQLRANLMRRKAQARDRRDGAGETGPADEQRDGDDATAGCDTSKDSGKD